MKSAAKRIQLWLLLLSIFMPNLFNFRLIGINLTFGRTVLIFVFLLCLYRDGGKIIFQDKLETMCSAFFFCWILSGILLIAIWGSVHKAAVKELMHIILGLMTVYSIVSLIKDSEIILEDAIEILRELVMVCILVGFFEIISGNHLESSCFCDPNYINTLTQMYGNVNRYQATGFQYGTNDFCSFLVFFFPVFWLKRKQKILDYLMTGAIAGICAINSSTLCMLTLILGVLFFTLRKQRITKRSVLNVLIAFALLCLAYEMFQHFQNNVFSLQADLENHLSNYHAGGGSSYSRAQTYIESLIVIAEIFFVGLGPANYTLYVLANPEKGMLLNPHNFWLEILTEYGVAILGFYLIFLIVLFYKVRKIYQKSGEGKALLIQIMLIDYIIIGIVPSTFISYLYQWILLGLGIGVVRIYGMKGKKR